MIRRRPESFSILYCIIRSVDLKKALSLSLLLTVFLPPVFGFNRFSAFEQTKELIFISCCSLSLLCYLLGRFFYPDKFRVSWSRLKAVSALFILALGVTALSGIDPFSSLIGKTPYFQGWI